MRHTCGDPDEGLNITGSSWRLLQPSSHDKDRIKAIAMNLKDTGINQIDRDFTCLLFSLWWFEVL